MISGSVTLTQPQSTHKQFVANDGRGHNFLIDDASGNTGPKPIELVVLGLAGCTAFDVIGILRKKRQQVTGYEVKVEADQKPDPPQVFTKVRIHHIVSGVDVSLSTRRGCDPAVGGEVLLGGRDGEAKRRDRVHVRDRSCRKPARSARKDCEADMAAIFIDEVRGRDRESAKPLLTRLLLRLSFALVSLAVVAAAQDATPLTLADAAKMTLANNPMHKAALADTKATIGGSARGARADAA